MVVLVGWIYMPFRIGYDSFQKAYWIINKTPFDEGSQVNHISSLSYTCTYISIFFLLLYISKLIYALIEAITESLPQTIIQLYALFTLPGVNEFLAVLSIVIAFLAIIKHSLFFYFNQESLSLARQHFGHDDFVQRLVSCNVFLFYF